MKILVHAHTTFSNDGDLEPQELANAVCRRGFDSVLVTDHFESLNADSFLELVEECRRIANVWMVPGYERSWRGYHVLALGVNKWCDHPEIAAWAYQVHALGGITVLAHPVRYHHTIPDDILNACDAVEVWNSKHAYDGGLGPNPKAYGLLGNDRFPMCGQDVHGVRHLTSVAVELQEKCTSVSKMMHCLRSGRYRMTNAVLSYGQELPWFAPGPLMLVHDIRRFLVDGAIRARRMIRSHGPLRPRPRSQNRNSEAAPAEN